MKILNGLLSYEKVKRAGCVSQILATISYKDATGQCPLCKEANTAYVLLFNMSLTSETGISRFSIVYSLGLFWTEIQVILLFYALLSQKIFTFCFRYQFFVCLVTSVLFSVFMF